MDDSIDTKQILISAPPVNLWATSDYVDENGSKWPGLTSSWRFKKT